MMHSGVPLGDGGGGTHQYKRHIALYRKVGSRISGILLVYHSHIKDATPNLMQNLIYKLVEFQNFVKFN